MSITTAWTELRFLFDRGTGLCRRGVSSLRTRGWRASWQRVCVQLRRVPAAQRPDLYLPAATPFAPFAVPASDAPRASIVIPVYNQFAHTLACLRAIAAHPPHAAIEVIVVDDGSSDDTQLCLQQVGGLGYLRRPHNGGFIAACNDGAALARGEYLVFLNNDTLPQPGWLDRLLATFDQHPGTGLVGAQLVYPDGRLQEAGGVVFADGNASNYGRFESPNHPRYGFVREADYCSGAAIAVLRELFGRLGGFDRRCTNPAPGWCTWKGLPPARVSTRGSRPTRSATATPSPPSGRRCWRITCRAPPTRPRRRCTPAGKTC